MPSYSAAMRRWMSAKVAERGTHSLNASASCLLGFLMVKVISGSFSEALAILLFIVVRAQLACLGLGGESDLIGPRKQTKGQRGGQRQRNTTMTRGAPFDGGAGANECHATLGPDDLWFRGKRCSKKEAFSVGTLPTAIN